MDKEIPDEESADYYWLKYLSRHKNVEDFMWKSTDHGPVWSEKEIKEAVNTEIKNLKRIEQRQKAMGRGKGLLKDFNPKKTKKNLIEYIKNHI